MNMTRSTLDSLIKEELVQMIRETEDFKLFQEGKINEAEFMDRLRGMGKWAKGAAMGAGMLGALGGAAPDVQAKSPTSVTSQHRSDRMFEMMDIVEALQDLARGFKDTEQIKKVTTDKEENRKMLVFLGNAEKLQTKDPELFNHYIEVSKKIRNSYGDRLSDSNIKSPVHAAAMGLVSEWSKSR
jgi:hypothetical protein